MNYLALECLMSAHAMVLRFVWLEGKKIAEKTET